MADVLPQEVFERIARHADDSTRRSLLTVSRSFQAAVERASWNGRFDLRTSNTHKLLNRYCGRRVRLLREVTMIVNFPARTPAREKAKMSYEDANKELIADDVFFTRQVSHMFTALKTLEDREAASGNAPSGIHLVLETPWQVDNGEEDSEITRYRSWHLHLLNPHTLPELHCIRSLAIGERSKHIDNSITTYERPLDLRIAIDIALKLPNLESLDGTYVHDRFPHPYEDSTVSNFTRPWEGPRRDSRHEFGKAIESQIARLPSGLRRAKLHFGPEDTLGINMNQSKAIPNLIKPQTYDPLSTAVRVLSQHLTELEVRVCADSTLFWPAAAEAFDDVPSWPHLRRVSVEFHPACPSGMWYFQGPRGEGREAIGYAVGEEHYPPLKENDLLETWDDMWDEETGRDGNISPDMFRITPMDETIEPFLSAFAKYIGSMYLLKEAELFTYLSWYPGGERRKSYPAPPMDRTAQKRRRWGLKYRVEGTTSYLQWQVGNWRPRDELMKQFHELAKDQYGRTLKEEWIDY